MGRGKDKKLMQRTRNSLKNSRLLLDLETAKKNLMNDLPSTLSKKRELVYDFERSRKILGFFLQGGELMVLYIIYMKILIYYILLALQVKCVML